MSNERGIQINCWISPEAARVLKQQASNRKASYGEVITSLLLDGKLPDPDWQGAVSAIEARLSAIEAQLAALPKAFTRKKISNP